jgi:hypothetical protein
MLHRAEVSDRKVSPELIKIIELPAEPRQSYNKDALINKTLVPVRYQAYVKYLTHALCQGGSGQIGLMPAFQYPRSPKRKATDSFPGKYYRAHAPYAEGIGSVVSTQSHQRCNKTDREHERTMPDFSSRFAAMRYQSAARRWAILRELR